MVAEPTEELRYRTGRGRWVIAATVLGSGMASLDGTVVGIALPTIGRQFHAGVSTLQWVVTGYTLTLAGLLLLGGVLGDRLGRQRVFIVGTVWFALASLALRAGAQRARLLIAARALQGIGGALLTPGQPGHPAGLVLAGRPGRGHRRLVRARGAWPPPSVRSSGAG